MRAHVNIGSNLGEREALLQRAVEALRREFGAVTVSTPVESEPWGFSSEHRFLNVGVNFDTDLAPKPLLDKLLTIQHAIDPAPHRGPDGEYIDRAIDIDLILLGNVTHPADPVLPHPRMLQRDFVMRPLAEIWPEWQNELGVRN